MSLDKEVFSFLLPLPAPPLLVAMVGPFDLFLFRLVSIEESFNLTDSSSSLFSFSSLKFDINEH